MAEDMLARGIAWDDLAENKSMIRGCGYNKSSWKRALAEGTRTPSATAAASKPTASAPVQSTQPLAFAHDMSHASFTAIDALGSLSGRLDEYEKQACAVLRSYHVCSSSVSVLCNNSTIHLKVLHQPIVRTSALPIRLS